MKDADTSQARSSAMSCKRKPQGMESSQLPPNQPFRQLSWTASVLRVCARQLLKDYTSLERKLADQRAGYLKKFARILPAAKVICLAHLENRINLGLRLQLASAFSLVPGTK
jgi:hypothetical protein